MTFGDQGARANVAKTVLAYAAMIAGSVLAFFFIRAQGRGIQAPAPSGASTFAAAQSADHIDNLLHVLLALLAILVLSRG